MTEKRIVIIGREEDLGDPDDPQSVAYRLRQRFHPEGKAVICYTPEAARALVYAISKERPLITECVVVQDCMPFSGGPAEWGRGVDYFKMLPQLMEIERVLLTENLNDLQLSYSETGLVDGVMSLDKVMSRKEAARNLQRLINQRRNEEHVLFFPQCAPGFF